MQADEIIHLFDHHRHDYVNDLQLLIAYAAMGNYDKVEEKLREKVKKSDQERRLSNLSIPKTALWLMTFNWNYEDIRLDYTIRLERSKLTEFDERILAVATHTIETMRPFFASYYVYQLDFSIETSSNENAAAEVSLTWKGIFENEESLREKLRKIEDLEMISFNKQEENTICMVSWSCK